MTRLFRTHLAGVLLCMTLAIATLIGGAAVAQVGPTRPEATAGDTQAMVARLSDEEVRALLLERLDATEKQGRPAEWLPSPDRYVALTIATASRVATTVWASPRTARAIAAAFGEYAGGMDRGRILRLIGAILAGFGIGLLAERAVTRRIASPLRVTIGHDRKRQVIVPDALHAFLRNLAGLTVAFLVLIVAMAVVLDPADEPLGELMATWLFLVPRLGMLALDFFLSPDAAHLRHVAADDATARSLYRGATRFLVVCCAIRALVGFLGLLPPDPALDRMGFWVNLLVFVWLLTLILHQRQGLRTIIRGNAPEVVPGVEWLARIYPAYAVTTVSIVWAVAALMATAGLDDLVRNGRHIGSVAVLLVVPLFDTFIRAVARSLTPAPSGTGPTVLAAHAAGVRGITRIGRTLMTVGSVLLLLRIWDVRIADLSWPGTDGQVSFPLLLTTLICLVGYLLWEVTGLWISRKLAIDPTAQIPPTFAQGVSATPVQMRQSRFATVLPVVGWVLQAIVVLATALLALGNIGIDVTALLAGAGIVGLAVGLGSQRLVSDFISGVFFLLDDAFRMGEQVEVDTVQGTVEGFSLRSMRLRHVHGAVYCIPYSSISRVTNFSRDWGIMQLLFVVPFGTRIEVVQGIFHRIGQDMLTDPDLAKGIIAPFESDGVREINEKGVVIVGQLSYRPGAQFMLRREVYRRVKEEFDRAGVQFARHEVRVALIGQGSANPTQDHSAAAAAGAAAAGDAR